jgi:hypothetical protein
MQRATPIVECCPENVFVDCFYFLFCLIATQAKGSINIINIMMPVMMMEVFIL